MAYVRRHWFSSVLYVVIIALGLAVWLTPLVFSVGAPESAQAQVAEPQPINPYLYTRVQKIRQELALTNRDLAAMGHTQESATALLESLRTWCVANQGKLDQIHRDEIQAKAALREVIRQINTGSSADHVADALPSKQEKITALYEQRKSIYSDLIGQTESSMDAYRLKMWRSARANVGLPTEIRYVPDLTDQHHHIIQVCLRSRSLSSSSFGDVVSAVLTQEQKQALEESRVNQISNLSDVRDAEAVTLPKPVINANALDANMKFE